MFAIQVQCSAAGDQQLEVRADLQEFRKLRCCHHHLLEVVEHEQQVLVSQEGFEEVQQGLCCGLFEVEGLGDGGDDQIRITDGGQRDEGDTIRKVVEEVGGDLEGKACFANAAGARQDEETDVWAKQESTG